MTFRDITEDDLATLPDLLQEGFPSTKAAFWRAGLDRLRRRAPVPGLPRYGIVLEQKGAVQGVLLMLSAERGGATFCNLSSWYVRPEARGLATFMFSHALRAETVTYLDCSPTPEVVPIIERLGFRPFTAGSLLIDARAVVRTGPKVVVLSDEAFAEHPEKSRLTAHLACGCRGLLAEAPDGTKTPLLYRVARLKRHLPVARFVYGPPETIAAHAGAISRHLLWQGIPLALVDWPADTKAPVGRPLPDYGVRYARGLATAQIGDLLDTEYAVLGI